MTHKLMIIDIFNVFESVTIPFQSEKSIIIKKPHQDFFYAHINKYNLQPKQIGP